MAHYLQEAYSVSLRRSLRISNVSPCMWYYKKRDRGDQLLRMRMKEIAAIRVRYGFERILIMLRREGFRDNHKRVYRVYREEGLNLRSKRPRRSRSGAHPLERWILQQSIGCGAWTFSKMPYSTDSDFAS